MEKYDKFKKVKVNSQNTSINFIDSLNKTKFEQLKEISQKTKIKITKKIKQDKNSVYLKSDLQPKRAQNKLKNYLVNTNSDYSKYNKVPHKSKKISNFTIDSNIQKELFPERASETHCYNNLKINDCNNLIIGSENKKYANTINNSNSLEKQMKIDENKYLISKILRSKLYNKGNKAKNDKNKPKIKIEINEKKMSLIKNIQNTKLRNKLNSNDEFIENFLILKDEYKNNYNIYNTNINDNSHVLYVIDDEENNIYQNINNSKKYSYRNDYDLIINNKNNKNIDNISLELLKLNERNWLDELDDISNFLINNREILDDNIYNKYIKQIIIINEHFNWLVNSISKYFNFIFYENNLNNINLNSYDLPKYENIWFTGFKWKGLYIRVVPKDKSEFIINEIKAMNYFFLDFIQIIDGYKSFQNNKNPLSNYIIFPLISYSEINGFVLYASTLIDFNQNLIYEKTELNDFKNIIKENKGYIQFYSNINKSSYYLNINKNNNIANDKYMEDKSDKLFIRFMRKYYDNKDLEASKLFSEINIYHFIKTQKEKFMIFNVHEFIPNLFVLKLGSIININIYNEAKEIKNDYSIKYDLESKKFINIHNSQNQIIQNLIKMKTNSIIKKRDIILCGTQFRIVYESHNINSKNMKSKNFVDYLFNYNKKYNQETNNFNIFKYESYINEPYIILYDLVEPSKLKYSLIKNNPKFIKYKNNNYIKESSDLYYINSNYVSYFTNWCKMINNNNHILSYYNLKKNMKRYGIASILKHLILYNIDNKDISDILKISFLVKFIKYIINKKESDNLLDSMKQKGSSIYSSLSSLNNNSLNEIRKENILYAIQSILYPNEVLSINKNFVESFYQNLVFYTKILFIKFKLINEYLSLNDSYNIHNKYSSPKIFLKQIIKTARKKPFLFIKELQIKMNFILNPYILFKSSLSIESMKNKLEKKYFYLNYNNITFSYINNEEISGFTLAKMIYNSDSYEKNMNNKNLANKSIKFGENDIKSNLMYLNSFNYYDNESHNSTYDSRKNNVNDNVTLLSSKLNISDSLTQIPKINEEYDILYENNFLSEIINDLLKDFIVQLQPNCYKLSYNFENIEESSIIYNKNINENSKVYSINKILKNTYNISDIKILYNWLEYDENIFSNIISFNGNTQHLLLKSFIFKLIFSFFIEKSIDKSRIILSKIKQIYNNGIGYKISLIDLAIIFLFDGLINEKNDELSLKQKESFYSKSLILLLMVYGDPRGRQNDSNEILLLPIFKIMNIVNELEKDSLIYDYFNEMFLSLDYTNKNKYISENYNDKDIKPNFMNYKHKIKFNNQNLENKNEIFLDSLNYGINNKNNIKKNNNNMNNLFYLLDNNLVNENPWKYFHFPLNNIENSTNRNNLNNNSENQFFTKEFILYFLNIIHHLMENSNEIIFNEQYIKENIANDLFIQNNLINDDKKRENKKLTVFKKSCSQKGIPIIETEPKEMKKNNKKIFKINSEKNIKRTNSGLYNNFSHFLYCELLQKLSYKLNSPSGVIISFGNNTHYETGLDETKLITSPHIIYKLKNKIIEHIYAGWEHNIIITKKGKIYSFGHNQCYQCGFPNKKDQESIKDPINLSKNNKNIKAISASCGNEHSLILSNEHIVYSFGSNEDGILGINTNIKNNTTNKKDINLNSYKLNKIDFGEYTNKIIEISSGTVHNLALTYDGKIFSWGSSQGGQLGLSLKELELYPGFKNNYYISYPIQIPLSKSNNSDINIIKISCGEAHSLSLTNEGKVYSWGFGSNGQLGLGFCEDSFEPGEGLKNSMRYKPEKIKFFEEEKICDIKCGKTFSMFVNDKGELFACGVNDLYQLGIQESCPKEHLYDKDEDTCYDFVLPTKVDYFLKMKVEQISCGEGHCLAVINDILSNTQTIWSWGNNKFGQLGQNIFIKKCLPRPINCLFEYNLFRFDEVACGGFHSLCLIKHKKNINWIEDDFEKIICSLIDDIGIY